jgi:serine protease AprX
MKKLRLTIFLNVLIAFVLTFSMLAASFGAALAVDDPPRINEDFLELVQENPDETFKVIVTREAKNKDLKDMELEELVRQAGGKVKKQLDMIVSFSAEMTGKEVEKLARHPKVHRISPDAPVVSTGTKPGTHTYRDEFTQAEYKGSDGTKKWENLWTEIGEFDGVNSGIVKVVSEGCENSLCLKLALGKSESTGVSRQVDLHEAASATLSFEYLQETASAAKDGETEQTDLVISSPVYETTILSGVLLQVSADGGATWTTLDTFSLENTDLTYQSAQYDLASYANANTQIRFLGTGYADGSIYIDNLEIEYSHPSPFREVVNADDLTLDGSGVTVVVVDSGLTDHMDLRTDSSNPTQAMNSPSRVLQNLVFGEYASPNDEYIHGNHVTGIIAGNGVASGGKYMGIAPGVNLINIRVSNDQGLTYTSDLIDSLQWILDNKEAYNIRVVNLSINSTAPESYQDSPLDAACEILWFNGITVVVAAGNNGTAEGPSTVYPPANDPFVITVGALEDLGTVTMDDDFVGNFSAYNTTPDGFAKPDIVAPGRNLVSLLPGTNATAYVGHPKHRVDEFYFRMSGTSMAAPVVTGSIALLLQDEPDLTPDQVKYRLMATANQNWVGYDAAKAGAGILDAFAAVNGTSIENANLGIVPSQMLATGDDAVAFDSVGWNSVGWNSVGWNSVGWNSVGWNSVGWNSVGWNSANWGSTTTWDD